MYSLLVVDDEEYAVKGITQGIDWREIQISNIYEAFSASAAMEIISAEPIDVVICDIEMPGLSGIDLLKWIKENSYETKTIILTGHANFQYAQNAVRLDCDDYLLKPVEHEQLKKVVADVLGILQKQRDQQNKTEAYRKYYTLWEQQKPVFVEHFWQDVINGRILPIEPDFAKACQMYNLPMDPSSMVRLILLKAEPRSDADDADHKAVISLAVRRLASERLFEPNAGIIVQDQHGDNLAILYTAENLVLDSHAVCHLEEKCRRLIDQCNEELNVNLTCYVGEITGVVSISEACKALLRTERENINQSNSVFYQKDLPGSVRLQNRVPKFSEWSLLLELGRKEELLRQIHDFLYGFENESVSREVLESFYHGLVSMLYALLHQNGIALSDALRSKNLIKDGLDVNSVYQAEKWAIRLIDEVEQYFSDYRRSESFIVSEIRRYIDMHLYQDFSREDLAAALHFNADYLSRVFKKETGMILSDYIAFCRIKAAKKLLEETNEKVGDIAIRFGYTHFSHFAKVFRNIVGMTPQEYRKKFKICRKSE